MCYVTEKNNRNVLQSGNELLLRMIRCTYYLHKNNLKNHTHKSYGHQCMIQTCWTVQDQSTQQSMDSDKSWSETVQCSSPSPSHRKPNLNQTTVAIQVSTDFIVNVVTG